MDEKAWKWMTVDEMDCGGSAVFKKSSKNSR